MSNTNTDKTSTKSDAQTPPAAAAPSAFPFPATFDPMAMWATTQQTWQKLMADATARTQSFADQYVAMEGQMIARAHDAISTWAQLTHDALKYSTQLSSEARKLGVDAARKMGATA